MIHIFTETRCESTFCSFVPLYLHLPSIQISLKSGIIYWIELHFFKLVLSFWWRSLTSVSALVLYRCRSLCVTCEHMLQTMCCRFCCPTSVRTFPVVQNSISTTKLMNRIQWVVWSDRQLDPFFSRSLLAQVLHLKAWNTLYMLCYLCYFCWNAFLKIGIWGHSEYVKIRCILPEREGKRVRFLYYYFFMIKPCLKIWVRWFILYYIVLYITNLRIHRRVALQYSIIFSNISSQFVCWSFTCTTSPKSSPKSCSNNRLYYTLFTNVLSNCVNYYLSVFALKPSHSQLR